MLKPPGKMGKLIQEMKETGQENEEDLYNYINPETTCAKVYTCDRNPK